MQKRSIEKHKQLKFNTSKISLKETMVSYRFGNLKQTLRENYTKKIYLFSIEILIYLQ